MINILPRLESEFAWLHRRPPTESELMEFCERHGVPVVFREDVPTGVYVKAEDRHFIFLQSGLAGWMLRYVLSHEIAHFLFHSPSQSSFAIEFFSKAMRRKNHLEAEQVAALMLLPPGELEFVYEYGADELYPEIAKLARLRENIIRDFGI